MVNSNKITTSFLWKLTESTGYQFIQFVVQIILARILLPEEYGLIAVVSIFILFGNVFIESGFNMALIQKKDVDEVDFSSVFYFNFIIGLILYFLLFSFAPFISTFYNSPDLELIIRILSITLLISSLNAVQNAYVSRNMLFRKLFKSSFFAILISGVSAIICASLGFGIWSLVIQQLTYKILSSLFLLFLIDWRPKFLFSIRKIMNLYEFGWKLLASALLINSTQNLIGLIIGKISSPEALGFYNRGKQFPEMFVLNINGSIQSVLFPTLSSIQDNPKKVKALISTSLKTSSFFIFPMMAILYSVAEPFILLLLTDKWLPAIPFLKFFCVMYALMPIHTINLQSINALGRSDIYLKLEIIKKIIELTVLVITINFGIYAIIYGQLLVSMLATYINIYPNKKLIDYDFFEQLQDISKNIIITLIMFFILQYIELQNLSLFLILAVKVGAGISIYIVLALIFKVETLTYLKKVVLKQQ